MADDKTEQFIATSRKLAEQVRDTDPDQQHDPERWKTIRASAAEVLTAIPGLPA